MQAHVVDFLLALAMLGLGWRIVATEGPFRAVVLFITFGLVVALGWVRLGAVDVALAEAALGSGVTGALLLFAYRDLERHGLGFERARGRRMRLVLGVLSAGLGAAVAAAVVRVQSRHAPLAEAVTSRIDQSGVGNPVTAVLLNFRGYDTLLEVGVLLAALLAVFALRPAVASGGIPKTGDPGLADGLVRVTTPVAIVVSGYLVWAGAYVPGGAFQAGAVSGAMLLLLVWTGHLEGRGFAGFGWRALATAGPMVFALVSVGTIPVSGGLLHYPHDAAGTLILIIELGITVSTAATLVLLCTGAMSLHRRGPR